MELPPAALLRLAVHGHRALAEQRLRLAARPDDPGNLERLPEPDGVAPDLDLPHVRDGSARAGAGRRQAESRRPLRREVSSSEGSCAIRESCRRISSGTVVPSRAARSFNARCRSSGTFRTLTIPMRYMIA